jgi:hypothetical protein
MSVKEALEEERKKERRMKWMEEQRKKEKRMMMLEKKWDFFNQNKKTGLEIFGLYRDVFKVLQQ